MRSNCARRTAIAQWGDSRYSTVQSKPADPTRQPQGVTSVDGVRACRARGEQIECTMTTLGPAESLSWTRARRIPRP